VLVAAGATAGHLLGRAGVGPGATEQVTGIIGSEKGPFFAEMQEVAAATGGKSFDARTGALPAAFKEIRGYQ
jgi:hypothetical protein